MPCILLFCSCSIFRSKSGHWRRWHLRDGNMNEIIRNGVTSMESGARTAPFIGSQYCLLYNLGPGSGWAPGHWSDLESWYSELYRASLVKEREVKWSWHSSGLQTSQRVWRKPLSACAPSHHTHVRRASLTFLNNNHKAQVKLFNVDYFAHLKNSNVEETNGRVWWADSSLGGSQGIDRGQTHVDNSAPKMGQDLYDQHFKPSLVWMISKFSLH